MVCTYSLTVPLSAYGNYSFNGVYQKNIDSSWNIWGTTKLMISNTRPITTTLLTTTTEIPITVFETMTLGEVTTTIITETEQPKTTTTIVFKQEEKQKNFFIEFVCIIGLIIFIVLGYKYWKTKKSIV
jgi:hypothetical protein